MGLRADLEEAETIDEFRAEVANQVQLATDGVEGGGMVLPEVEQSGRQVARAGAADQDSRQGCGRGSRRTAEKGSSSPRPTSGSAMTFSFLLDGREPGIPRRDQGAGRVNSRWSREPPALGSKPGQCEDNRGRADDPERSDRWAAACR